MTEGVVSARRKLRVDPFLATSASLPALGLAALWSLGVHGVLVLHHWPRPMLDDPKFQTPGLARHAAIASAVLNVALVSPLAVIGLLVGRAVLATDKRPARAALLLFAALYAALWLQLLVDPGHLCEWLAD